jgi:hypothetical protein
MQDRIMLMEWQTNFHVNESYDQASYGNKRRGFEIRNYINIIGVMGPMLVSK